MLDDTGKDFDISVLKQNIRERIKHLGLEAELDLISQKIGKSPSYLRGMIYNKSDPGATLLARLANELNTTSGTLLGETQSHSRHDAAEIAKHVSESISSHVMRELRCAEEVVTGRDILLWWHQTGGQIGGHEKFLEHVDLYQPPEDDCDNLSPIYMGPKSLASQYIGEPSPDAMRNAVAALGRDHIFQLVSAYKSSMERGTLTTIESVDVSTPSRGKFTVQYLRTLARVERLDQGRRQTFVLTHAELLESRQAS